MRVVFMGSPEFALPTLRGLLSAGFQLPLVVTQPDRPAGRGRHSVSPPVARAARESGLTVYQTATLRSSEARAPIELARPDAIVVASFGLLLPQAMLDVPPLGCLNVHPSLLPRHRGASPIPATLLAGDAETGVSIMLMEAGLDSGPILSHTVVAVGPNDDALSLERSLAELGANLLVRTLRDWVARSIVPRPQGNAETTYAPKIRREDALLDWRLPARELERRVRAYRAWPVAYTLLRSEPLKVLRAESLNLRLEGEPGQVRFPLASGRHRGPPAVITGDGLLILHEVVPAGRGTLSGEDFARGQRDLDQLQLG